MIPSAAAIDREEWRLISESDGLYSVSNLGRVRSEPIQVKRVGRQRGRVLVPSTNRKGYFHVALHIGDERLHRTIHSLVASEFIGDRPEGMQVNHKNGIKADNRPANLEYVTCMENIRHAHATGLCKVRARGERNSQAKLTADAVHQIRLSAGGLSLSQIADRFGITKQNASFIINHKTWRHVA